MANRMRLTLHLAAIDNMSNVVSGAAAKSRAAMASLQARSQKAAAVARSNMMDSGMAAAGGALALSYPLRMAANYERLRIQMNALTGDIKKGGEIYQRTISLAENTPLQLDQIATGVSRLMGFGRAADDAMDDIKMLGDVVMVTGGDLQLAMIAYGQAAGEGRIMTRDLTQLVNAGVPIFQMLEKVVDTTGTSIKQLASEGKLSFEVLQKAFQVATREGGQFEEGMKTMSQSAWGQLTIITDQVNQLAAAFGDALLPELKSFGEWLTPHVKELKAWIKENQQVAKWIMYAATAFTLAAAAALILSGTVWLATTSFSAMVTVGRFVVSTVKVMRFAFTALHFTMHVLGQMALWTGRRLLAFASTSLTGVIPSITAVVGSISGWITANGILTASIYGIPVVGWALAAAAAVATLTYIIYKNWDEIKNFFVSINDWFMDWSIGGIQIGSIFVDAIVTGVKAAMPRLFGIIDIIKKSMSFFGVNVETGQTQNSVSNATAAANVTKSAVSDSVGKVTNAAAGTLGFSGNAPEPIASNGGVSVSYSPSITVQGGGESSESSIAAMLEEERSAITKLVQEEVRLNQRKRFG